MDKKTNKIDQVNPGSFKFIFSAFSFFLQVLLLNSTLQLNAQFFSSPVIVKPQDANGDQVAVSGASSCRAYESKHAKSADIITWVQIDLGKNYSIDNVKLYPFAGSFRGRGSFPARFKIEASDDPSFSTGEMIADRTSSDYPNPGNYIMEFKANGIQGQYIRITVTRLSPSRPMPSSDQSGDPYFFSLSKVDVISGGKDVAVGCKASADPVYGNEDDLQQITRSPRPMGEYLITDNKENVTPESFWKPLKNKVNAPLKGVTLKDGIFHNAMQDNINYLLNSFTTDQLLRQFRERAGKFSPSGLPDPIPFWESQLEGSNAGRFLMGAGNTLRWIENAELKLRMNTIVDGIEECRQSNGYIMAYPDSIIFNSERAAYTRSWTTHGLLEAGYAGNQKAFELLRGYYDWYNQCSYLPRLYRGAAQGGQGMVANTRMYFTPVGKAADIQTIQRYFQETYWLKALASRDLNTIWQYPYDRPHCYLLTNLEAYTDMYRATGDRLYLDAILGAWDMMYDNWINVGGSISIIEGQDAPPKSNYLYDNLGETCGSVFWILINQRLHNLFPDEEKYMTEIERLIYNVILANQKDSSGIRYHTKLIGVKERPTCMNTCCEGQGTRILASLAEYIYSLGSDGMYVNLYEPSVISYDYKGIRCNMEMLTQFPYQPDVKLMVSLPKSVEMNIHIRIPSWSSNDMPVYVNGQQIATGKVGSYLALNRKWSDGDIISFTLPMQLKMTAYEGVDQIPNHGRRYALEYGPILMAAVGNADLPIQRLNPTNVASVLKQKPGQPLHFEMAGNSFFSSGSTIVFMPYWEIDVESFSCFPALE